MGRKGHHWVWVGSVSAFFSFWSFLHLYLYLEAHGWLGWVVGRLPTPDGCVAVAPGSPGAAAAIMHLSGDSETVQEWRGSRGSCQDRVGCEVNLNRRNRLS